MSLLSTVRISWKHNFWFTLVGEVYLVVFLSLLQDCLQGSPSIGLLDYQKNPMQTPVWNSNCIINGNEIKQNMLI